MVDAKSIILVDAKSIILGDCLELLRDMPDRCVDLVFTSPPYEAARTYGIDYKLKGQAWVDWCVDRYVECVRICKGLVAWVVEGQTRQFRYSAVPALLIADLHRCGVNLRKPPIFQRVGIPGSGGPDWLRNDWEWIVCATQPGKLPWSENCAMGKPPVWEVGGAMSNRTTDGQRINANLSARTKARLNGEKVQTRRKANGVRPRDGVYKMPTLANPGNIIKINVGGGVMGSTLCHANEAPFPEKLAEFFIRSFCPEDGIVLDPFCGSGTTLAVAERWGRKWIGMDVRESQVELSRRRVTESSKPLLQD